MILADKAISDPKVGKEWCQRTNRAVFTWRIPCCEAGKVTYQDRHSRFNNNVRDAIRRGAAENEVQKYEEKLTGVWRQMSTLRRRYEKWCKGDDIEDCTHKQRYEASYQSKISVCGRINTAGFYNLVALFNTMNSNLGCILIAQIIGKIEDDPNEYICRIRDMYMKIFSLLSEISTLPGCRCETLISGSVLFEFSSYNRAGGYVS